ncbi:hypothetical protein WICMUC_001907 [Wickerhamomyces mucosus]|uniref:Exosome complex protein n=1 Tax=Wickerhamomyces mucosus TaxID=1378264 RepID=A0A9P8PS64_9ASCO|nr:hypothetical protein WICMUC_001907 [Wickerhamomyces mucosus]
MENTELINQFIKSLNGSLDSLDGDFKQLVGQSFEDRLNIADGPLDRIKISNNYAYILTSLSFAYLKSIGIDTSKHPIMDDLNRVKSYVARLKEVENQSKNEEVKSEKDTEAAKRFINAALNSGTGNSTVVKGVPEPAISSASFKGTHTKFKDESSNEKGNDNTENHSSKVSKIATDKIRNELKTIASRSSQKVSGKVSKPSKKIFSKKK